MPDISPGNKPRRPVDESTALSKESLDREPRDEAGSLRREADEYRREADEYRREAEEYRREAEEYRREADENRLQAVKLQRELDGVLTISRALSSRLRLDDLVRETLEVSLGALSAGAGGVYLYDEKKDRLVFRYMVNNEAPEAAAALTGREIEPDQGIAGQVFTTGVPRIDNDPAGQKQHLRSIGQSIGYLTRNMITAPLVSMQGKTIGSMQAINKADGLFDESDLNLLTIMAAQAATAIENARLFEEARAVAIMHTLGDLSHDLKNLMTPAETGAQTLEMILSESFADFDHRREERGGESLSPEEVEGAFGALRELGPEMIGLIFESLDASRDRVRTIADAMKGVVADPVFEPIDAAEAIDGVVRILRPVAAKGGVTIAVELPVPLPAIPADRKRLHSALYNLVNNAIPETPPGGAIAVRAGAVTDGEFPDGAFLRIVISDTGRGMTEEVKRRLFTDDAVSTKPGGTGLGTRIVKDAVALHGGRIDVESEPGRGSTFTIRLPLTRDAGH